MILLLVDRTSGPTRPQVGDDGAMRVVTAPHRFAELLPFAYEQIATAADFDDETCRLEPIESPFGPKVFPMSPE
jgi:hypothetical protein